MTAYTTTEKSRRERRDVYEESTTAVLAALGRGTIPWRRPWSAEQGIPPRSVKTGKPYRGVNFFQLAMAGYESPWWLTFKHAKDRGAKVRKGEHGQTVVMWKRHRRRLDDAQVAEARAERPARRARRAGRRLRRAGVCPRVRRIQRRAGRRARRRQRTATPREPDWQPEARAAAITAGYDGPSVAEGGSRALYQPQRDHVQMPDRGRFATARPTGTRRSFTSSGTPPATVTGSTGSTSTKGASAPRARDGGFLPTSDDKNSPPGPARRRERGSTQASPVGASRS